MEQRQQGAGPSNATAASVQRPSASWTGPLSTSFLLQFQDARLEAGYQQYMYKMQQTADLCLIVVNLFAVAAACIKQYMMPISSGPQTSLLCILSGAQTLLLLLLLLVFPATYAHHRGLVIGCTRLYRLAVWLLYLREPYPPRLFRRNLSLRLFLLSPAGGNIWLALFYPLPLPMHLMLLGMSSIVAIWRSLALQQRLQYLNVAPEHLAQAHRHLSRFSKFFELPSARLLQHSHIPEADDGDRLWCMYAFVTLVYGLLLPLLLLFIKEVHFRVRFLSCLRPSISEQQLTAVRSRMYSITTAACFLIATMVPCSWSLVQLASRYLAASPNGLKLDGVLLLLTVLILEVFVRLWLLTVFQLLWQRVVRPGLLWLLLCLLGRQGQMAGAANHGAVGMQH